MKNKLNKTLSQKSKSNADISHTNSWGHKLYFKIEQEWDFDLLDSNDSYIMKSLKVGDRRAEIKI
jgi:hypothetical protein